MKKEPSDTLRGAEIMNYNLTIEQLHNFRTKIIKKTKLLSVLVCLLIGSTIFSKTIVPSDVASLIVGNSLTDFTDVSLKNDNVFTAVSADEAGNISATSLAVTIMLDTTMSSSSLFLPTEKVLSRKPRLIKNLKKGGTYPSIGKVEDMVTVKDGVNTYVLVASAGGDAVQIIDITNPSDPEVIDVLMSDEIYTKELVSSEYISTVLIKGKLYAIVIGYNSYKLFGGLGIIDITDIKNPKPVVLTNNKDGYTLTGGHIGSSTVKIGDNFYVLVGSHDKGIEVIDITNPSEPKEVAVLKHGGNVSSISTVKIGAKAYVISTDYRKSGVKIIDITNPSQSKLVAALNYRKSGYSKLKGVRNLTTVFIENKVYALFTSSTNSAIQIIDITNPQSPIPVEWGDVNLYKYIGYTSTVKIGVKTYALVAEGSSSKTNGILVIDITNLSNIKLGVALKYGKKYRYTRSNFPIVVTAVIEDNIYAIGSNISGGVQIIQLNNTAPVFGNNTVNKTIDELEVLNLTLSATDAEGDPLEFSIATPTEGLSIDKKSGVLTWTPNESQSGTHTLDIRVNDGITFATQEVTIIVNDAPTITVSPNSITVNKEAALDGVTVTGVDTDIVNGQPNTLTYSLISSPPTGLSIDSTSGVLTWTPTESQVGTHNIEIQINDGRLSTTTTLEIIVNDAPTFKMDVDGARGTSGGDGIMVIRYISGVKGSGLVKGQSRTSSDTVETNIHSGMNNSILDVDGTRGINGGDGIMIIRYISGVRGSSLVSGQSRTSPGIVEANIAKLISK